MVKTLKMRINIFVLILLLVNSLIGQDTMRMEDILKKAKSKNQSGSGWRLENTSANSGPAQDQLAKALDPYVFVVETQYRLTKDGKTYGKEDMAYFGHSFGLAISQGKELWMDPMLVRPWTIDADYEDFKTEYDAKLHQVNTTAIINGAGDEWSANNFEGKVNDHNIGIINFSGRSYQALTSSENLNSNGMLVLYFGSWDQPIDSMQKKVQFIQADWKDGRAAIEIGDHKNLMGGFYLECLPERGAIKLKLAGIVVSSTKNLKIKELLSIRSDDKLPAKEDHKNVPDKKNQQVKAEKPRITEISNKKNKKSSSKK